MNYNEKTCIRHNLGWKITPQQLENTFRNYFLKELYLSTSALSEGLEYFLILMVLSY